MKVVDLFCGAGGTSTGILAAGVDLEKRVDLVAVNHWQTAINTHSLNHPGVRHICGRLENIQPFITHLTHHGERRQHSVEEPTPTVTGAHRGELALIEPILLGQQSGHNGSPVDEPCPTVATSGAIGLVEPFIVKYYGSERDGESINQPLATVTSKDRFMLVEPKTGRAIAEIDILFRMLQPHELSAAMGFPKSYQFSGNRGDQVKQIGNAVPVELARAHTRALLSS